MPFCFFSDISKRGLLSLFACMKNEGIDDYSDNLSDIHDEYAISDKTPDIKDITSVTPLIFYPGFYDF